MTSETQIDRGVDGPDRPPESTMLAGRLNYLDQRFVLRTIARPVPRYGEVLVRVRAAGVCLSDVHLVEGSIDSPLRKADEVTLGHEIAGQVEYLGEGVTTVAIGDRVVVSGGALVAGEELSFGIEIDGGWAEYVAVPVSSLTRIPDSIGFEQAAIVPDAVTTPWEAITLTAKVRPGESVGVWGAGGLGLHAVRLLTICGATPIVVIDPSKAARQRALEAGADAALDPRDPEFEALFSSATGGGELDVAMDFAGVPDVRRQALRVLTRGGRLVLVGISGETLTIDEVDFIFRQLTIVGHYGGEKDSVATLLRLIEASRLDVSGSVSVTLPLSEAERGLEMLRDKVGDPVRIVLLP